MRRLALILLLLVLPVWAQPPSPPPEHEVHEGHDHGDHEGHDHGDHEGHGDHEPAGEDREWTGHGAVHEHNPIVEAGGEYSNPNLHAKSDDSPAVYRFMIRESNSEPYRLKGQSNLVFRDAAVVWGLNILLIIWFFRKRR